MSKRNQDEVSAELVFQMQDKLQREKQREDDERMYAELWEADMMAKVCFTRPKTLNTNSLEGRFLVTSLLQAKREEREAVERHARNKEQLAVLHTQMAALEEKKAQEKRLIEEQAELLVRQLSLSFIIILISCPLFMPSSHHLLNAFSSYFRGNKNK